MNLEILLNRAEEIIERRKERIMERLFNEKYINPIERSDLKEYEDFLDDVHREKALR